MQNTVHVAGKDSRYLFAGSIRLIDHSLFCFFGALDAGFTLVQFRGAVFATEIPAAAVARHEGHLDSIIGFASRTLAGTAGFRHCYVSTNGCIDLGNVTSMMGHYCRKSPASATWIRLLDVHRSNSHRTWVGLASHRRNGIIVNRHTSCCRLMNRSQEATWARMDLRAVSRTRPVVASVTQYG